MISSIRPALPLIAAGLLAAASAHAQQSSSTAPAAKPAATKPAAASKKEPVSASRQQLSDQAKNMALATEVTESISNTQLEIANRVLTGNAQCEFDQSVGIEPLAGKPGMFRVSFKQLSYVMAPQETTTGAVRLEDKRAGVIWLQIPSKSMLIDHKGGKRLVDSCMLAEQRASMQAAKGAASALGIAGDYTVKEPEALKAKGSTTKP